MNQVTIFLCTCGELPQFGWHDLYGDNLHCRECGRNTEWCADKTSAVAAWNALIQKYFKVRNLINDLVLNTIEHTIHAPYEKRADLSTFTKYIADEWMQHNEVALFAAMRTEETEMKAEKEEIEKSDVARTSDHIKMSGKRK